MAEPTLYLVFLGGDPAPGRLGEDHEVVVVVADDLKSARAAARKKWTGVGRAHVDAIRPLTVADGYSMSLSHTGASDELEIDNTFEP